MAIPLTRATKMAPKRKAPADLSQNPHAVKTHKRKAEMSDTEAQIDKAKKADASAVRYAITKLKKTAGYIASDEEGQASMRVACSEDVLHKRYVLSQLVAVIHFRYL
jgi:hypothetical protein